VHNVITRYLARKLVPTMMGFDPLFQFLHETDAIGGAALGSAARRTRGVQRRGRRRAPAVDRHQARGAHRNPIPHPIAETLAAVGWVGQLVEAPPSFLKYLRFLCVADGRRAHSVMGFRAAHTSREALLDFVGAQRLRDVKLLSERTA